MGKVITGIGNAVKKVGQVAGGLFAKPSMPSATPAPEAVLPAPAAAPTVAPTQAGPEATATDSTRAGLRKGKKSVTVSRTSGGGGVGLNV